MNRRLRGENGDAVTETVILVPVLLLLIMTVVPFGLWYHAEHVAQAAAQEGVRAARSEGSTADDGKARTEQFLSATGSSVIDDTVVTGSYNFSRSAQFNAENILFIESAALAKTYSGYIDHLIEKYR